MALAPPDPAELIAVASHELRAPITALMGFASTLRDHWRELPERDVEVCVDAINRQAERLAGMVDDLLTASLADVGAARVNLEAVAVDSAVVGACTDSQVERTHEVIVKLPSDLPQVRADSPALSRILVNLLTNAARYSRRNTRIEVGAAATTGGVDITVRDHGPGIDPAVRDRLFEKFSRSENGPKASSGLGLYIVGRLAEMMGASIGVDSSPGEGTTFTVSLPRADRPLRSVDPTRRPAAGIDAAA